MINQIVLDKKYYFILSFWTIIGIYGGSSVYFLVPLHALTLVNQRNWLWLLLGFWMILTFSDSGKPAFSFAQNLKPILLLLLSMSVMLNNEIRSTDFIKPFIPFFIISFWSLQFNPEISISFQKTLSYLLLLITIPSIVNFLLQYEKERFLRSIIITGILILSTGLVLLIIYPTFVNFDSERYSGLLGNPNAIGIYCFLFFALIKIINHFHPYLFSRKELIIIYGILFISLFLSGSRGGIFASSLFFLSWILLKRSVIIAFLTIALLMLFYQIIITNFEQITIALNLDEYFRLETLRTGSGRVYAKEIAWQSINENFWFSNGFNYSEYILQQHKAYFIKMGHIGNFHNSFLTIWVDTGLFGLIFFSIAWLINFLKAAANSPLVWAVFYGLLLSISVESWLIASLNPFTIILVIILSLMANKNFYQPLQSTISVQI
jgi:O-antigen ligase